RGPPRRALQTRVAKPPRRRNRRRRLSLLDRRSSQLLADTCPENQDHGSKSERQRRRCPLALERTQEACEVRDAHLNRVAGKARGESGREHDYALTEPAVMPARK